MAEPAERAAAEAKGQERSAELSAHRHEALERRADPRNYDALLNGRPAGARPVQSAPNRTGLPDRLKAGVEALSGLSMEGVKVHYNSSKPAQLQADAFTQGSEIHVAPGQERHLPHEAWHVVQQAQGRVRPMTQLQEGTCVNDDKGLEHEADVMGARAGHATPPSHAGSADHGGRRYGAYARLMERHPPGPQPAQRAAPPAIEDRPAADAVVQRVIQSTPATFGPPFVHSGRAGAHDTAANLAALEALRAHRQKNPSHADRHVNNENEQALAAGPPGPAVKLNIAHHVSDHVVQQTVVAAANAYNLAPAAGAPAAWGPVDLLMNGIHPPGFAAAIPAFAAPAAHAFAHATAHLNALRAAHPIAHIAAMDTHLTDLADGIANSPMNLHLGEASANASLSQHGDPNNYQIPGAGAAAPGPAAAAPALGRQLTWRSEQMRAATAGLGGNPLDYRTLADARAMPVGRVARTAADAFNPAPFGPADYVYNSASPPYFVRPV